MHGGAPGSGAPQGNQNALKHGVYAGEVGSPLQLRRTREAFAERQRVSELLRQSRELIAKIK
jgi:glucans biosynthesis protein